MNSVKFLFAKCNQGQTHKGVKYGYKVLNHKIPFDCGIFKIRNNMFKNDTGYKLLKDECYVSQMSGTIPFTIGGDHSISMSTVSASLDVYKENLSVVWVDAHADINTYESSDTKNTHGMPLSILTGKEKTMFCPPRYLLGYDKLSYFGIRDLDTYEKKLIEKENIQNITSEELNNNVSLEKINIPTNKIHLSLDVDVLDPIDMTSTGTAVNNGIKYDKLEEIIKYIALQGDIIAVDLVEFNPEIGSKKEKETSFENYKKIFDCICENI